MNYRKASKPGLPWFERVLALRHYTKLGTVSGPIEVTIAKEVEKREVLLSVRDHGIGIAAQQQAQIFQRFVQAENARAYGIEGTGSGLYLCRAIIERRGGRIWFESTEEQGSTFFIALPVVSAAAPVCHDATGAGKAGNIFPCS